MQEAILQCIQNVPAGSVFSYGQIAAKAGFPGRARLVARLLAQSEGRLPWHRVMRSSGTPAFAVGSELYCEQIRRLEREGIVIKNGRVKLSTTDENLDALLWAP